MASDPSSTPDGVTAVTPSDAAAPVAALDHRAGSAVVDAVPAPHGLDRRAVERVLARAAELQGVTGEPDHDAIDESRLIEIAKEAGLTETSVRQALAEERTRIDTDDDDARLVTRLSGPAVVSASRVVPGTVAAAVTALDAWMQREECLIVQRRFLDRMVWEPRSDWLGTLRRNLRLGGRSYQLARARHVAATVVPLHGDDGTRTGSVLVRLDADVSHARAVRVRVGATAGAGAAAIAGSTLIVGTAAHAALLAVLGAAAFPLALGGGLAYSVLQRHRQFATRTALALEQVLDRLEYGDVRRRGTFLEALGTPRPLYR